MVLIFLYQFDTKTKLVIESPDSKETYYDGTVGDYFNLKERVSWWKAIESASVSNDVLVIKVWEQE